MRTIFLEQAKKDTVIILYAYCNTVIIQGLKYKKHVLHSYLLLCLVHRRILKVLEKCTKTLSDTLD